MTDEGGLVPTGNDPTNSSDGTNILVNPATGAASTGSVSGVNLASSTVEYTIQVGLEPTALILHDNMLFVANTNSDTISVIDPKAGTLVFTFPLFRGVAYGSQPNDINFLPDGTFVVSLGGNNALALYTFVPGNWALPPTLDGLIPTGWYPGFIAVDNVHNQILVSNVRGIGLEGPNITKGPDPKTNKTGPAEISTYSVLLQIDIPNAQQLAAYTNTVIQNNSFLNGQVGNVNAGLANEARSTEPTTDLSLSPTLSVKPHRSNTCSTSSKRTAPTIKFWAMTLAATAIRITPSWQKGHPEPARIRTTIRVVDNYYAPSLNSADGHQWANQALAPDYLEKELNTNARSYPSAGGDAMAYASSGFLWQNLVNNGGNLRVYGEYAYEGKRPNNLYGDWSSWYNDSLILEGKKKGKLHCPLGTFPGMCDVPNNRTISISISRHSIPRFPINTGSMSSCWNSTNTSPTTIYPHWFTYGCVTIIPAASPSGSLRPQPRSRITTSRSAG